MAILGSIFALLGRVAGRLLNSALGWATILLFGKVSGRKQTLLLVVALGSLLWIVTLIGILFPSIGTFLLAFVPVPDFVDEGVVRLIMLGLALLIPLAIGVAAVFLTEASRRPKGGAILGSVLRGYPFTLVLAVTIVLLSGVSLVRKVRSLTKRWDDAHVAVIVKPGAYDQVLAQLEKVLRSAGMDVSQKPAPAVLSVPPRLLDAVAGKELGELVPDKLMLLVAPDLEALIYPSDIAISGTRANVARARAAIASELTRAPAYMTSSAESERLEDAIAQIAEGGGTAFGDVEVLRARLKALDPKIATLSVPFEEWETVYRMRLQVERDLLRRSLQSHPDAAAMPARRAGPAGWAIGLATLLALTLDLGLQLLHRARRS